MFSGYWVIVLITCFSLMCGVVDVVSDGLHQPQNLNVSWNASSFSVTLQWSEQADLDTGCNVKYNVELYSTQCPPEMKSYIREWPTEELSYTWNIFDAIDAKCVAISTEFQDCGNKTQSEKVYKDIPQPKDLVSNVSCTYYAVEKMNCTWNVVTLTPDLQFFYNNKTENILQPCVIYIGNGHTRTGCHLYGEEFLSYDMLYISFTGSYEGRPIKNMFLRNPGDSVTSQPPKFNITMKGDNLVIQSSHPNFKENCWLYYVHVSKCNEDGQLYTAVKDSNWSVNVPYDESCQYRVRVKANYTEFCGSGASDWSEIKEYGANNDPNLLVKAAAIVIPISISCCLIIALMLFRRHKDKILPKVPEPSLLFRDMFNDNKENKMSKELHVGQLYVPSEELVEAKLHVEPKSTLLHLEG